MTHSLYRRGDYESLKNDYVLISRPAMGINHEGCAPKLQRSLQIIFGVGPTNLGSLTTGETIVGGLDPDDVIASMEDNSPIMCCFSEREKVVEVLRKLKEAELGISVVLTGLLDDVQAICDEIGLKAHSVNMSLGVHGNTELLPEEEVLRIATMCGHGMVAAGLVRHMRKAVNEGKVSPEEAATVLAQPCLCGIFNTKRAAALLSKE
ncbi:MAG: hypothetical protein ACOYEO_02360 [bacterium]|jgi:hypothetical protein